MSTSNSNPSTSVENLTPTAREILTASLSQSSREAYHRSWKLLQKWHLGQVTLPISPTDLCNFIAYLFENGYSPSSISSHVCAIGYLHKILVITDPTESFLVKKIIRGCHKLAPSKDTRLPSTDLILKRLLNALDHTVSVFLNRLLLKALFLLAFNAFLRLGEITVKSNQAVKNVIQRSDVSFEVENGILKSVTITLKHYKTNTNNTPFVICIQASNESENCPVNILYLYTGKFGHSSGPLFQFTDCQPVTYSYVTKELHKTITFIGLDPKLYKGHSSEPCGKIRFLGKLYTKNGKMEFRHLCFLLGFTPVDRE